MGPDGALRLTTADSGRTFSVPLHTVVVVSLAPELGSYHRPSAEGPGVLVDTSHKGGYPETTTARATFQAPHPGRAVLTSGTDMACLHTTPACLPPQREFTVVIIVSR